MIVVETGIGENISETRRKILSGETKKYIEDLAQLSANNQQLPIGDKVFVLTKDRGIVDTATQDHHSPGCVTYTGINCCDFGTTSSKS